MGFDIECIIDIHSYPGEYFCPVCRTLVYPNEAFQAQCTHLYCKPCLVHIANGSKACPYDGYLVTESDSKPLAESDKALAEKVGKVKVHCLYFRSGCTWEGTLSDCPSHCAGCSFGNSPVICNRCGIQIIHRQVHDHAQICPGGYDGQQAVASASGVTRSATTSTAVTAVANQTVATSGAPVPQAQTPQNVSASQLPGQNANLQANTNTQAPAFASAAMPAPDQWYQQQYQQYYQQYAGYDPYQQQQYYPPQQQQFQQYQQHAVQVQGQHQSHVYSQAVMPPQPQGQAQVQPQPHLQQLQPPQQTNPVSQAAQQPHLQPQVQGQAQPPPQPQLQMLPPQTQAQLPPQGQAQANAPVQALAPNYQVNPQQQPHSAMRPQTQIPLQALPPPPPQGHPSQPPQYPQAVGLRPPAQHPQAPQYQQGQGQMHHHQGSQAHLQPQMHPQTQGYVQSSSQSNVQSQPQAQHYQSQPQHPVFHSQTNQPAAPAAPPQAPHPPLPPVSGHHSYQQPHTTQKMQPGAPQQHVVLPHPASGSMHPVQVYAQTLQQPTPIRPPQSHGSFSQQLPSAPLPLQNQVAGIPHAPHQQFLPHGQQPAHPIQHRPVMQPVQQVPSHNYAQHQQLFAPFQGQLHQHGHLPQQPPMQSQMQMRPSGPPQPQQSQNYPGTPLMPNQGIPPQSHPLSSGGFGASGQSGPAHGGSTQASINQNQNYAKPAALEQNATVKEIRSPKKELEEKGFEGDSLKEEVGTGLNGTLVKDADDSAKDGSVKSVIKQEKGDLMGSTEQANEGKPIEAGRAENENREEDVRTLSDSVPLKQADPENLMKLSKTAGLSSGNFGNETFSGISVSSAEGHVLPQRSHGSHQERSQAQLQGQPSSTLGAQGPGTLPHAGQSINSTEGKVPGNLGGLAKSFESLSGNQGPSLNTLAEARGTMGKPPFESQYGSQHIVRPMSSDQMSGSGEWRPLTKSHSVEPNHVKMNGGAAPDPSMFGSRDENSNHMSKEHLNPFAREPTSTFDQAPRSLDKPLHGHSYDAVSKLDPGATGPYSRFLPHHQSGGHGHGHVDMFGPGPEFGNHHLKPFPYHSPGRDYLGSPSHRFGGPSSFPRGTSAFEDLNSREAHRFGEGSRSFNLSSDLVRNPFGDGRFPPLPGHLRRGDIDDLGNSRFGEHRAPGLLHNQIGADDVFGPDGPGHSMKGKFSGPGYLSGHFNRGETAGPGALPGHGRAGEVTGNFPRPPFSESARGDMPSFMHLGEPLMRNNYPYHGMPNAVHFSGGLDLFDQSRKRKPISNGWCRICEFDCETVEGLEMHSQTREHQNMAMDMVKRIKLQNKRQRAPGGHMVHEGGSRTRKVGTVGHGSKP